jgi:long-chain-fatty-acid--CoA ligase ACSBG
MAKVKEINGSKTALMVERPVPEIKDGSPPPPALPLDQWTKWTFSEYMDDIRNAAKGMVKLGFQSFDSVNIWGFNSPEWVIAALASSFAGGKVAGLYPTDTQDTAAFKVVHSGGSVVLVEDRTKLKKLVNGITERGDAKRIKVFVAWGFEPAENETVTVAGCGAVRVISWKALLDLGKQQSDDEVNRRIEATQPGHCAALIYTSGTTGEPKAVMISHDCIIYESSIVKTLLQKSCSVGMPGEEERIVSYLPLSHVAGMMVDIVMPAVNSASESWTTTYFARPYDLKAGSIKDRLVAARPTIFLGVPLVWEKIADKMRAVGASVTGLKKKISTWAKEKALTKGREAQLGGTGEVPWGTKVSTKILHKVKEALGLECVKFGFTGAAPIRVDTLEYFASIGIQINEVYGMSECTGACTFSLNEAHQWGSCGWEIPGIEVRVFKVDPTDLNKKKECPRSPALTETGEEYMGEICWRGRGNMMGYLAQPDLGAAHVAEIQKKTGEAIDRDGWLHSGDKGMITDRGMVKITGRYKELIIGDGGENIAPVPIEDNVKKLCDGICEIMMVGDKRKYNVALVTLKAVGANGEVPGTDNLDAGAKRVNPSVSTISGAMEDTTWIDTITQAITATNKNPKVCINNSFTIQKFTILPTNFSEENSELTPTKKLKRAVVEKGYKTFIDKMYAPESKGPYVRYSA